MTPYELRLRAEWAALKAEDSGFTNTRDALLEIARLYLPEDMPGYEKPEEATAANDVRAMPKKCRIA